ncbi:MAG: PqqD family protein [Longimicrobiales bacterium]
MISKNSTVVATTHQVSCTVHGEAVILQMKDGVYYSLDAVGARVWSRLQQPASVNELCQLIVSEYEVDLERCEQDLLSLLQDLEQASLIEVK